MTHRIIAVVLFVAVTDDEEIRNYLRSVQSSLHVSRKHRRRALEEIETHIHVGSVQHMSAGATRSEAVEQVIAELGPPEISFVENTTPASRITGVRRWLPLMLPAALLTMAVMAMVWTIVAGLEDGWTYGHQLATWWYGRFVAIDALLVWAAVFAIRRANSDPAWRRGAWACTGCVDAHLILDYGPRLLLAIA